MSYIKALHPLGQKRLTPEHKSQALKQDYESQDAGKTGNRDRLHKGKYGNQAENKQRFSFNVLDDLSQGYVGQTTDVFQGLYQSRTHRINPELMTSSLLVNII